MFKEIENELMSIMSDSAIEKIAHTPSMEIAKTMDLIYNIKFDDIQRVYFEKIGKIIRLVVVYDSKDNEKLVNQDICPVNGRIYHITLFPSYLLSKDENNAITLGKAVVKYSSIRVSLLMDEYKYLTDNIKDNTLNLVTIQSIPVITCAVLRQIYSGPSLPKIIHMVLSELLPSYKLICSEQGINSILNLFDEGLGVEELLDSGFICSIPVDDQNYPGIWCVNKEPKIGLIDMTYPEVKMVEYTNKEE